MFVANPLSGLASGPQWLTGIWGEVGQLLAFAGPCGRTHGAH